MCWILGEYAYLMGADVIAEVCDQICEIAERITSTNSATRAYAITAVIKLTAQYGRATTSATALVLKYANSSNSDLQQRCYEFMELSKMPHMMREVLPVDASYEDLEVDPNLPFLDAFVQEARDRGMPEYSKPVDNNDGGFSMTGGSDDTGGLNFAAYATPTVGNSTVVNGGMISGTVDIDVTSNGGTGGGNDSNNGGSGGGDTNNDMFSNLKVTKNVWGSSGFTGKAAGMNPMNSNNTNDNTNSRSSLSGQYTINSTSSNNTMSSEPIEASIVPNSYNDTTSTTSGETKQTYTEPEPEPEPEISQREQEAMALFGGISSATTSTKKSGGRIRTRRNRQNRGERKEEPPVTEQPDAKVENNSGSNDLLDLMGGGGDTSTSSGGADDSVNMFADLGGDSSGGNGSANSSSSGGLLDMGDLMGGGSNNGGGMFDGLGGGMESTSVQQQPPGLVPGGLASTQEFGQLWVSLSNSAEVTSQVQSSNVRTPEAFMGCMSTRANLQGIQAISQSK
jgi:AP-4 complex subunit epsilon-1